MTRRTVALRIYAQLIAQVLHLDPSMRIVGARTEQHGGHDIIVFSVDCPEAPAGTLEMVPVYQRSPNIPDPVQLVAVEWTLRDGTREMQQIAEPPGMYAIESAGANNGLASLREAAEQLRKKRELLNAAPVRAEVAPGEGASVPIVWLSITGVQKPAYGLQSDVVRAMAAEFIAAADAADEAAAGDR